MSQAEFNVEISDYGFDEAESYFDERWNNAIKITENDELKEKIVKVIEQETLVKEITPFEAYLFVLKNYLDTFRGKEVTRRLTEVLEENGYKPYRYQLDAVQQALSIIENNNGVIIANVVGLGKTVIACSIAFELKKRGIVIAPPGIIGDKAKSEGWKKYLEQFHLASLGWEAFSLGDLEHVSEFVSKTNDIEVVIIDEAHQFRNEDTKDYEYLKNIVGIKSSSYLLLHHSITSQPIYFRCSNCLLFPKNQVLHLMMIWKINSEHSNRNLINFLTSNDISNRLTGKSETEHFLITLIYLAKR